MNSEPYNSVIRQKKISKRSKWISLLKQSGNRSDMDESDRSGKENRTLNMTDTDTSTVAVYDKVKI